MEDKIVSGKNSNFDNEDVPTEKLIEDMSKMLSMGGMSFNRKRKVDDEELKKKERKFWGTQPVPKFSDEVTNIGPIDTNNDVENEQKEPYNLPKGYIWYDIDIHNSEDLNKVIYLF
jgi:glycylpeptide N-tetradecanoyltransferase